MLVPTRFGRELAGLSQNVASGFSSFLKLLPLASRCFGGFSSYSELLSSFVLSPLALFTSESS
eukprot:2167704-Amphidinium_carterae.1